MLLEFLALPLYLVTLKYLVTENWRPRLALVYLLTVLVGLQLLHAYVYPDPLPRATLTLTSGRQATGGYLVQTGGVWYLVQRNESLRAIPDSRIAGAKLARAKHHRARSLAQIVRAWFS